LHSEAPGWRSAGSESGPENAWLVGYGTDLFEGFETARSLQLISMLVMRERKEYVIQDGDVVHFRFNV